MILTWKSIEKSINIIISYEKVVKIKEKLFIFKFTTLCFLMLLPHNQVSIFNKHFNIKAPQNEELY